MSRMEAQSGVVLDPPAISSLVASLSKGSQWQGGAVASFRVHLAICSSSQHAGSP